jgi:hypothetical protein
MELNKLYQQLVRLKLYDNPEKTYSRSVRPKKHNSGNTSTSVNNVGVARRKMKQLHSDSSTLGMDPLLLYDTPLSPKSPNIQSDSIQPSSIPDFTNLPDEESRSNNIVILKTDEYEKIKTTKYSLSDLRILCKHYGIKKSGTKSELIARVYVHLKQSCVIVKLQRCFRQYISMKYRKLSGPAFLHPKLCVNDTDFYTFDPLIDIEPHHFFSYIDDDGKTYGFHIASIYNLIISSYPDISNPYNRNLISPRIIQNVYEKLIYGSLLNLHITIKLDEDDDPVEKITPEKQEELYIVGLFQHINTLGNYSDSEWFVSLQRTDFLRFIRHIHDIWSYRANLSQEMKDRICPPNGNPFMLNHSFLNLQIINLLSESELRTICVSIIDRMVKRGTSREDQCLGAFYVLATLTIVNQNARNALPWLYEAVL